MIDVSIVLTVYNAESYIEGCLDMITGQTLRNIQIICVDDGSTDNSAQIIEQYAQKDDRIVLIREKNAGAEMLVVIAGEIMRMPGLPKEPQALHIDIVNGEIEGLS